MYGIELLIIIVGTFGQVLAGQAHGVNIFNVLIIYRFVMGVGIGGDYPLSAVIASEFSNIETRGRFMTAVVAAQGWGQLTAAIVSLIVTSAYKSSIIKDGAVDPVHVDNMWRVIIGLGMVPACLGLYFRLTIPETPRFTLDVERNFNQAKNDVDALLFSGKFAVDPDMVIQRVEAPTASWKDFFRYFWTWKNGKILLGVAYSWFALDVAFYGLSLNSSIILNAIGFSGTDPQAITSGTDIYESLRAISIGNIILSAGGLLPGYYATMLFIDSWGRKKIQIMGFTVCIAIFCCMGKFDTFPTHHFSFYHRSILFRIFN
jgi:MFS transporter, PHS family, inorganic phosphate transporter